MKTRNMKVLELTDEDVVPKRNNIQVSESGKQESEAEVILFKGYVLKNVYGPRSVYPAMA